LADPVFYLHHTQVDRLWWMWQQQEPGRMAEFEGPSENVRIHKNKTYTASAEDMISLGSLAPRVRVAELMSTESSLLCYGY